MVGTECQIGTVRGNGKCNPQKQFDSNGQYCKLRNKLFANFICMSNVKLTPKRCTLSRHHNIAIKYINSSNRSVTLQLALCQQGSSSVFIHTNKFWSFLTLHFRPSSLTRHIINTSFIKKRVTFLTSMV